MKDGWQELGGTCPVCGQRTETLVRNDLDYAERCDLCDWLIRFDDGEGEDDTYE